MSTRKIYHKTSTARGESSKKRAIGRNTRKLKNPYKKSDYDSNDGMLTTVWGPGMWHYLHTMSFNYPVNPTCDDKRHYRDFILNLQYVLPCGKCRKNLKRNLKRLPLTWKDMASRATFSKYIYRLHETVNHMLNKKSGLTYETVRTRYEHFRARCAKPFSELKTDKNESKIESKIESKAKPASETSEKGCTEPLYGEKSKCILKIVPDHVKCKTMEIDKQCIKQKL